MADLAGPVHFLQAGASSQDLIYCKVIAKRRQSDKAAKQILQEGALLS